MDPLKIEVEWDLPKLAAKTGLAIYQNRNAILDLIQSVIAKLSNKSFRIAVVGTDAVGKTTLVDYLTGRGSNVKYNPPQQSLKLERNRLDIDKKQMLLLTFPGQEQQPRYDAEDAVLLKDDVTVDGIIYVVANGLLDPRHLPSTERHVERGFSTLEAYQAYGRKAELEDLKRTLGLLRQHWIKHKKRFWIIVAIAKADLYYEDILAARSIYELDEKSEFVQLISRFRSEIGALSVPLKVVPVCTYLKPLSWNGVELKPQIFDEGRALLLHQFLEIIAEMCND